jgi:DNA-binding transcriptional regulator YiaG
MAIHAYNEMYLSGAQRILGDAVDFAVNCLNISLDRFETMFMISDASKQFAAGNPTYVAGMTGCELVRTVISESGLKSPVKSDIMMLDKSPEYWTGYALASLQWYYGYSFDRIFREMHMREIRKMYPIYHEMDIMQFIDAFQKRINDKGRSSQLKRVRTLSGLSQSQLAKQSSVPLRQIQLLEQHQRDINKTQAANLLKLSRVLHCSMEDLME